MPRTVVAITGASSGIGEVFARKLAGEHDLLLVARRLDRLHALAEELQKTAGAQVRTVAADLTLDADQEKLAEQLRNEKRLVLLVNNAGFGTRGRFWESPVEAQEQMHRLHVMATVRLTHAALQILTHNNRGGIINVSSVSAFIRSPGTVSYAATKTWITTFTEGIHLELKSVGSDVVVQALCPGFTYSEFHDSMGVDRHRLAGSKFWMSAEFVVDESLDGLRKGKLFVIPGWRYRLLTAFLSKLPESLRLGLEQAVGRARTSHLEPGSPAQATTLGNRTK